MFSIKLIKVIDFILSIIILAVMTPILILFVLLNFFIMGFPIFFISKRIGLNGIEFKLIKFRSMDIKTKLDDPDKISSYGKFLRRTSIDELPQLLNILIGDMSLIGPRPLPKSIEDNIKKEYVLQRRNVKPGITGYSQINYSGKKRSLNEKIKLDLYYIENLNILIYFKIIFLTPVTLIKRFIFNRKGSTL